MNAVGNGRQRIRDGARVNRRLVDVTDGKDASVGMQVLPHFILRIRVEECMIFRPAVAEALLHSVLLRRQTANANRVASEERDARRFETDGGRLEHLHLDGLAELEAPIGNLRSERTDKNI